MADEATIRSTIQIVKGNIRYQPPLPAVIRETVDGEKGPVPGALTIAITGTNVDFSQLDTPGLVRIINYDDTNYVEWGIWSTTHSKFFPLGEILPGRDAVFRFSRNLREEYTNTGTGTSAEINNFHLKANTAACVVSVEAFEA